MITTFDNRVSVQLQTINSDVKRFNSIFEGSNAYHLLLGLSLVFSILMSLGRVIEAHNAVMSENPFYSWQISTYFASRVLLWGVIYSFSGRRLL